MSAYRADLPFIPLESWRGRAACLGRKDLLWDDRVEGETDPQRDARHVKAEAVCHLSCPVREECGDSVDPKYDDGVRGGHLLPTLHALHTDEEAELVRLLRKGWPLDQAVVGASRHARRSKAS